MGLLGCICFNTGAIFKCKDGKLGRFCGLKNVILITLFYKIFHYFSLNRLDNFSSVNDILSNIQRTSLRY